METEQPQIDPLAPDAPILHLLSLRENPNAATCSDDELRALVLRCRTLATSPQLVLIPDNETPSVPSVKLF
jgi:hypothetical protein